MDSDNSTMVKLTKCIVAFGLLLLQSCQNSRIEQEQNENKTKGQVKAAVYNTQLGLGYLKQGNRPRAKSKLFTALKQDNKNPDVLAALAYYFEQTEQPQEAASYYMKAIKLSRGQGAQFNNYGAFLCRQGQYQASLNYFERAVADQEYTHTAGAYENAGLCSTAIPDISKASYYFRKALEQEPERRSSFYELVKIAKKQGNNNKIFELMSKYPFFKDDPFVLASLK